MKLIQFLPKYTFCMYLHIVLLDGHFYKACSRQHVEALCTNMNTPTHQNVGKEMGVATHVDLNVDVEVSSSLFSSLFTLMFSGVMRDFDIISNCRSLYLLSFFPFTVATSRSCWLHRANILTSMMLRIPSFAVDKEKASVLPHFYPGLSVE